MAINISTYSINLTCDHNKVPTGKIKICVHAPGRHVPQVYVIGNTGRNESLNTGVHEGQTISIWQLPMSHGILCLKVLDNNVCLMA